MLARLRYVGEVLRHAAPFAGWVAGLVTLLYGGSIIGGAAWLANTHHRTLAVALLLVGVLLAFVEGSFRVWGNLTASLAAAHASMTELEAPEAKRAFIDEQRCQERDDVEDLVGDLDHWEDEVRADLKESFSLDMARLFSSDAVEPTSPDGDGSLGLSRANSLA